MKIGCCSDTHGAVGPHRAFQQNKLPSLDGVDLVLHAGDLYEFDDITDDALLDTVDWLSKNKVLFVHGNHDVTDRYQLMVNNVSGKVARLRDGLWLVGIGWGQAGVDGAPPDVALPSEAHLIPQCSRILKTALENMSDGDHTIVLTHYPALTPKALAAQNASGFGSTDGFFFDCVKKVCEALNPILVLQGHAHSMTGKAFDENGIKYFWPGPKGATFEVGDDNQLLGVERVFRGKMKKVEFA